MWVGTQLIKKFRQTAETQELILLAFQEQRWRHEIDDPLPGRPDVDRKSRLYAAIENLNRYQKIPLLHFCGNGRGEAIRWEWRK